MDELSRLGNLLVGSEGAWSAAERLLLVLAIQYVLFGLVFALHTLLPGAPARIREATALARSLGRDKHKRRMG